MTKIGSSIKTFNSYSLYHQQYIFILKTPLPFIKQNPFVSSKCHQKLLRMGEKWWNIKACAQTLYHDMGCLLKKGCIAQVCIILVVFF